LFIDIKSQRLLFSIREAGFRSLAYTLLIILYKVV